MAEQTDSLTRALACFGWVCSQCTAGFGVYSGPCSVFSTSRNPDISSMLFPSTQGGLGSTMGALHCAVCAAGQPSLWEGLMVGSSPTLPLDPADVAQLLELLSQCCPDVPAAGVRLMLLLP